MLAKALEALKDMLRATGYAPDLVETCARDWGVRPELLLRKFKEATGRNPEDYRLGDADPAAAARARCSIDRWRRHKREDQLRSAHFHREKRFRHNGHDCVGRLSDHETSSAIVILNGLRVGDKTRFELRFPTAEAAVDWLLKHEAG